MAQRVEVGGVTRVIKEQLREGDEGRPEVQAARRQQHAVSHALLEFWKADRTEGAEPHAIQWALSRGS